VAGLLVAISLVLGVLVGSVAVGFGAWFIGIPLIVIGIGVAGGVELMRRRQAATDMRRFREQAQAQKADFTPSDRRTQVTE
jgi:hypothetical protein